MKKETKDAMRKTVVGLGKANTASLFGPENLKPQTSYEPANPAAANPKHLDMSPKAVKAREKSTSLSLLAPALIIAGVVIVFAAAIFFK